MDASPRDVVARARDLALEAHREQKYGDQPYSVHLEAVQRVLDRFGLDDDAIHAAAWMHDMLEDTGMTRAELAQMFPEAIVAIVDACTDGEGATRDERKQRSKRLIAQTHNAILVKLADRIANVEASLAASPDKLATYRSEHPGFAAALRASPSEPSAEPLWTHLQQLLG